MKGKPYLEHTARILPMEVDSTDPSNNQLANVDLRGDKVIFAPCQAQAPLLEAIKDHCVYARGKHTDIRDFVG